MREPDQLFIPGRPVPYPRSSINRAGRRFTPEKFRQWQHAAAWLIRGSDVRRDIRGPVRIRLDVHSDGILVELDELTNLGHEGRARPKHVRGDLDNYSKAVLDAIQFKIGGGPGWIDDDRQVVNLWARFDVDPYEDE